jgi:hypothetical protein
MKDADLLKFAQKGKQAFVADGAGYSGFGEDEIDDLIGAVDDFDAAYAGHKAAQNAARLARAKKDLARKRLRKMLGNYIKRMRSMTDLPVTKLVAFGVEPADTTRTPIKAPETAPQFDISYVPTWHIIKFWEQGSQRHRRKPEGVIGAEIYVNFGGARDDLDAYVLKQVATRSSYTFKYEMADVGKQVHYYLVWLTRRGERSPMSRIESATIAT